MRTASRQQTSPTPTNSTTKASPASVDSEALWALLRGVVDAQLDEPPIEEPSVKDPQIDQIKEIDPDQILRVGGSPSVTRSPARTSASGERAHPNAGAFDTLIKHPEWSCRQAACELGVSVGTIHNWRELIKLGARPQAPGRPEIPLDLRAREALKRWHRLVVADPREGLVRIVRRLWARPRNLGPAEIESLHTALCKTPHVLVMQATDGLHEIVPIDPHSIAEKALGANGRSFVDHLRLRVVGDVNKNADPDGERHPDDDDELTAYEAQIRELVFGELRAQRRARRRRREPFKDFERR